MGVGDPFASFCCRRGRQTPPLPFRSVFDPHPASVARPGASSFATAFGKDRATIFSGLFYRGAACEFESLHLHWWGGSCTRGPPMSGGHVRSAGTVGPGLLGCSQPHPDRWAESRTSSIFGPARPFHKHRAFGWGFFTVASGVNWPPNGVGGNRLATDENALLIGSLVCV